MASRSFPGPALLNRDNGDESSDSTSDNRNPAIMPGLDLLNHNPSAQVAWLWDSILAPSKPTNKSAKEARPGTITDPKAMQSVGLRLDIF